MASQQLSDLLEDLTELVHWKIVGYFLNIDPAKLNIIQKDHGTDCSRAKLGMLNVWMKNSHLLRVEDLIGALYDAGEREIAEAMEKKHGVVCKGRPKREFAEIQKILDCCRNLHGHIPRKYGRIRFVHDITCLPGLISVAIKILRDTLSDFFSIFPPKCLPYQWPDKYLEKYIEPAFYEETQPATLVPNTTQSITLTDLANTFKHSPVVVKGMAGSGKTHFVHRLAYLWAQGKLLQQFSLLFLLSLDSTPALQHLSRLIQVYLPFGEENSLLHEIADEVIKMKDNKVLIIVDGWDENIAENCIVSQVVKRVLLSSASLLIMCRPGGAHSELNKYCHRTFSLLPLDLDQIMSTQSLGSQLISLLRAYPELRSTCEIPYFLNSLVFVCQKENVNLCPTLSTLLQLLLNCFMKQCSSRLGLSHEILYDFLCKAAVRINESKDRKIAASEMEQLCNAHNLQIHTVNSIGVFVTSTECSSHL